MRRYVIIVVLAIGLATPVASADVLVTTLGNRYEGTITRDLATGFFTVQTPGGSRITFPASMVKEVLTTPVLSPSATPTASSPVTPTSPLPVTTPTATSTAPHAPVAIPMVTLTATPVWPHTTGTVAALGFTLEEFNDLGAVRRSAIGNRREQDDFRFDVKTESATIYVSMTRQATASKAQEEFERLRQSWGTLPDYSLGPPMPINLGDACFALTRGLGSVQVTFMVRNNVNFYIGLTRKNGLDKSDVPKSWEPAVLARRIDRRILEMSTPASVATPTSTPSAPVTPTAPLPVTPPPVTSTSPWTLDTTPTAPVTPTTPSPISTIGFPAPSPEDKAAADIQARGCSVLRDQTPGHSIILVNMGGSTTKDADLDVLRDLKSLRTLFLPEAGITDAAMKTVVELKGLESLGLMRTAVSDAGLEQLKGLRNLKTLELRETRITDAGLKSLKEMKALENLTLSGCPVTDAGLETLKGMIGLKYINLVGCKTTETGRAALRRALPKAKVFPEP
jgi:hypothetical protein